MKPIYSQQSTQETSPRKDVLTPSEKEINYVVESLIELNKTYSLILNDELDNRDNPKAFSTFQSQVLSLYKFLKPKILNSKLTVEITYNDVETGEEKKESINKFYELIYSCDELETFIITKTIGEKFVFVKHPPTVEDLFYIYSMLRSYIEDSKMLVGAKQIPGING